MNYVANPNLLPNCYQIKQKFEQILNSKLENTNPEFNILLSNDVNSCSRGKFFEERHKYIGKIISIFVIEKNKITQIVGPILIDNVQKIIDLMYYINEFIPTENVYIDEVENIDKQIFDYYDKLNLNNTFFTNIIYS